MSAGMVQKIRMLAGSVQSKAGSVSCVCVAHLVKNRWSFDSTILARDSIRSRHEVCLYNLQISGTHNKRYCFVSCYGYQREHNGEGRQARQTALVNWRNSSRRVL